MGLRLDLPPPPPLGFKSGSKFWPGFRALQMKQTRSCICKECILMWHEQIFCQQLESIIAIQLSYNRAFWGIKRGSPYFKTPGRWPQHLAKSTLSSILVFFMGQQEAVNYNKRLFPILTSKGYYKRLKSQQLLVKWIAKSQDQLQRGFFFGLKRKFDLNQLLEFAGAFTCCQFQKISTAPRKTNMTGWISPHIWRYISY